MLFVSRNSFWIFLWSYLTIIFVSYGFSFLSINIYLKLALEFAANCILLVGIVKLQRKIKSGAVFGEQRF